MSFPSKQSRLLAVAGACLIVVLVVAWQLAGRGSQPARLSESQAAEPRDPVVAAGDLRAPEAPGASQASDAMTTATALETPTRESLSVEHADATEEWITIPGLEARVENLPGTLSGRCEMQVEYGSSSLAVLPAEGIVSADGVLRVPPTLCRAADAPDRVEFRFEQSGVVVGFEEVGTGRKSLPLDEGGGWTLQPEEQLAVLCVVDESGAVLWDEPLRSGGALGWIPRRAIGWLIQRRAELEQCDKLQLTVRDKTHSFPGDLYPVDADGLMRVPLAELGRWDRELVIVSDQPLHENLRLRIEQEWRGEYRVFDAGSKRSDVRRAVYPKRTRTGWVCKHVPPAKYRVTMFLGERRQDGEWLIGEADLTLATRAVLTVPPFEFRSLVVKVQLPEDFDDHRMHPLRVRVDGQRSDARWINCQADHARFDWLGPRPTHGRISGKQGPMLHKELPLTWRTAEVAVLDASAEALRRCKIDAPEDGTPLIAQELTQIKIGGPPASVERVWTFLPADDALWELCWWEGASFDVPLLERDAEGWRQTDEIVLIDSLSPQVIGTLERFVPRRLSGHAETLELVGEERGWVHSFAWLGGDPPSTEACDVSFADLNASGDWLSLGMRSLHGDAQISVPTRANGILLIDQRAGKRVYLPRGAWSSELPLDELSWR
jgi:hypothetical protein